MHKSGSQARLSPMSRVNQNYEEQVKRIQITKDWKDKSVNQEKLEADKLEKFIEEEKMRAHFVANEIHHKQLEADRRRENI